MILLPGIKNTIRVKYAKFLVYLFKHHDLIDIIQNILIYSYSVKLL